MLGSAFRVILSQCLELRANGHNNSQHCCANNVVNCCDRVGSAVQTDATTSSSDASCITASWEDGIKITATGTI